MRLIKTKGFCYVYETEQFRKDFERATNGEERYRKWLMKKLSILEAYSEKAILLRDFEALSGTVPKLYSIRYPHSVLNPRVIYFYFDGRRCALLTAFKEKSANDYESAIKVAKERLKQIDE